MNIVACIGLFSVVDSPCNGEEGQVLTLNIEIVDAPEIRGWSATIAFDPEKVTYIRESFQLSTFIPQLQPLVHESSEGIVVGGTVFGTGGVTSGNGHLGMLQLSTEESIELVDIAMTEFSLNTMNHGEQQQSIQWVISFSREQPLGDFTGDGVVNFSDFFLFGDHFGGANPQYDIVPDGTVDFRDFFLFAESFGMTGDVVGHVVIPAHDLQVGEDVRVVGSTDTTGVGVIDIVGTIVPEDTTNVEVIGTIAE